MVKKQRFHSYNLDIERLVTRIEAYLVENNFQVALSRDQSKPFSSFFVQARKTGVLRTAAGARRSTNIIIEGTTDDFEVKLGTGEWGNNLIVSAPLFVIPVVGITATLARFYTAKKFENNLWKYIKEQAEFLRDSAASANSAISSEDRQEFDCDYVGGYPDWDTQIRGGKLVLERKKHGFNKLIFESPDGEQITIPVTKIEKASIVPRRRGLAEDDLLVEVSCTARNGKPITPIFNLSDAVVTGVLAGINELVVEEMHLRSFNKQS